MTTPSQVDDVKIKMDVGLDHTSIQSIQEFEKELDNFMATYGFARTESGKSGSSCEFRYHQFCVAK